LKTFRSKEYLEWIGKLPCLICGAESVPHHEGKRGMGIKASDFDTIPLCNEHHQFRHQHGRNTFAAKYGFVDSSSYENVIKRLNKLWEDINA